MATSVRTIQPEEINWCDNKQPFVPTVNTPSCGGPFISSERGQDRLACARCQNIRNLAYDERAVWLSESREVSIFGRIVEDFPFVEFIRVACGQSSPAITIVYPIRPSLSEVVFAKSKLKEQFMLWRSLRLGQKLVKFTQIFNRLGYHPVVLPNAETVVYENYGGNEGIEMSSNGKRFKVVDLDMAFKSGKHIHSINYVQSLYATGIRLGEIDYSNVEIF